MMAIIRWMIAVSLCTGVMLIYLHSQDSGYLKTTTMESSETMVRNRESIQTAPQQITTMESSEIMVRNREPIQTTPQQLGHIDNQALLKTNSNPIVRFDANSNTNEMASSTVVQKSVFPALDIMPSSPPRYNCTQFIMYQNSSNV